VTSSPLYQPMESIERLGYELRVFIRVPDLGMNEFPVHCSYDIFIFNCSSRRRNGSRTLQGQGYTGKDK